MVLDKHVNGLYNNHNPRKINRIWKGGAIMKYAAISENMIMDMCMCRMCMRTLRYALTSESFSAPEK